jgi:hypothetical protein
MRQVSPTRRPCMPRQDERLAYATGHPTCAPRHRQRVRAKRWRVPFRRRPKGPVLADDASNEDSATPSPEGILEGSFSRANRPDSLRYKIARHAADRRNRRNSRVTRHRRGNERNEQELPRGHLRLRARATGKWVSLLRRKTRPSARRGQRRPLAGKTRPSRRLRRASKAFPSIWFAAHPRKMIKPGQNASRHQLQASQHIFFMQAMCSCVYDGLRPE